MYLPGIGEIVVFVAAMLGGLIGFLWYNTYPAQVLWVIQEVNCRWFDCYNSNFS